jgi:hypothetical protein
VWCFSHDPAIAERRREGQQRGGVSRSRRAAVLPADTPDAPLSTLADVAAFLGATANQVRRGELDPRVGNCLAVLCGTLARAIEHGELERRIEALEAKAMRRGA